MCSAFFCVKKRKDDLWLSRPSLQLLSDSEQVVGISDKLNCYFFSETPLSSLTSTKSIVSNNIIHNLCRVLDLLVRCLNAQMVFVCPFGDDFLREFGNLAVVLPKFADILLVDEKTDHASPRALAV